MSRHFELAPDFHQLPIIYFLEHRAKIFMHLNCVTSFWVFWTSTWFPPTANNFFLGAPGQNFEAFELSAWLLHTLIVTIFCVLLPWTPYWDNSCKAAKHVVFRKLTDLYNQNFHCPIAQILDALQSYIYVVYGFWVLLMCRKVRHFRKALALYIPE